MSNATPFPTDDDKNRITWINKFQNLYDNNHEAVFGLNATIKKHFSDSTKAFYIAHSIPQKISDFYADLVQGDPEMLKIESSSSDAKQVDAIESAVDYNNLVEEFNQYALDQSIFGFFVLLVRIENATIVIDKISNDQYFPQADGSVKFVSYIKKPNAIDEKDVWAYVQHYFINQSDKCEINRKLYEVSPDGTLGNEISLSLYNASVKDKEVIEINELPIVQVNNIGKKIGIFGRSDYIPCLPQLEEINERETQKAIQFLKNLDAKLQVPAGFSNKATATAGTFDYIEITEGQEVKFITNDNPMMGEADKHIEKQLSFISFFTSVPMFALLSNGSVPERVESMKMRYFDALRKADAKRVKIKMGLDWALRIGLMMLGIKEPDQIEVSCKDLIFNEPEVNANIEEVKLRNGLTSKRSAMKRLDNLTDEEIDNELKEIGNEEKISGIGDNLPSKDFGNNNEE